MFKSFQKHVSLGFILRVTSFVANNKKLVASVCNLIDDKGESDWGMTSLEVDNILARRTTWSPLWTAPTEKMTKNKTTTAIRNENQLLYQPALVVVFDSFLLNNDGISTAHKEAMGIHQRVKTTTPVPDPTQAPRITITYCEALATYCEYAQCRKWQKRETQRRWFYGNVV